MPRAGRDREQYEGVKRHPFRVGARMQQRSVLCVREEPSAAPRLLLAADVADRIAVDQPALFDREGEPARAKASVPQASRAFETASAVISATLLPANCLDHPLS